MSDGTGGMRAATPQIDTRILRHILLEATDLLDESAAHAYEGGRSTQSAMALTRSHWLLMSVYRWITEELEPEAGSVPAPDLGEPVAEIGIDYGELSPALQDFAERVDRLHARTRQLQALTSTCPEAVATPTRSTARVLNIFGDPDAAHIADNPVLVARERLDHVLSRF